MNFFELKDASLNGKTIVCAHRGSMGANVPCNTLEAFQIALNQGADIIELDVTKSRDGELFVFHPYMDFAHLGKLIPMQLKSSKAIKKLKYRNFDFALTQYGIPTLDEAFELLKGKCVINIDKFWTCPKEITKKIYQHGIEDSVIIKSNVNEKDLNAVAEIAPKLPYMPMVKSYSQGLEDYIINKGIKLVAEELIFEDSSSPLVSDENLKMLNDRGLLTWVNTIVYYYKRVISGGYTDDKAVVGNPHDIWGWCQQKGFNVIQTDWVGELKKYLNNN